MQRILRGERLPQRNVVIMNAAAALVAGEKAMTLEEGGKLAQEIIDNGSAVKKLEDLIKVSNRC
jgi:anthranilate phosphoribosyltransferase